jgi:hypothetical protein
MIMTDYTPEDLKKLPLRAIVALSARCARRVQHLALLPEDHPESQRRRTAVANAFRVAEEFARGLPCASLESAVQEIEAERASAQPEFLRYSAMAAVVQAAHSAAAAHHALELRDELKEPQYSKMHSLIPSHTWRTSRLTWLRARLTRRRSKQPQRPGTPTASSTGPSPTTRSS